MHSHSQQTINLCTLVSGVAQNFATSCELIRHIFSSFWEDSTRVMSLHRPTQRRPCTTVPLHSEHIWQMPIRRLSLITVNETTYFLNICSDLNDSFPVTGTEDKAGLKVELPIPRDRPVSKRDLINSSSLEHCQTSPFLHRPWIHYQQSWLIRAPHEKVNQWTDSPCVINRLY